jgi:hypothetical protein
MKNILYEHVYRQGVDSPSDRNRGLVLVTEEVNCYVIWVIDGDNQEWYGWRDDRDDAIRTAVDVGRELSNVRS